MSAAKRGVLASEWTGSGITYVSLKAWPGDHTPPEQRRHGQFRVGLSQTIRELTDELTRLRPTPIRIFLEGEFSPTDVRSDGYPRADARPLSPGVVLRAELGPGQWMPLPSLHVTWGQQFRADLRNRTWSLEDRATGEVWSGRLQRKEASDEPGEA